MNTEQNDEHGYEVYDLVIKKQKDILESTGKNMSIKEIIEKSILAGIESVK